MAHEARDGDLDFQALVQALNDPAIKSMAEQIALDPVFVEMGAVLKKSFAGMMQPVAENEKPKAPAFYMAQMASMLDQPEMQKVSAEIGQKVINSDPNMQATIDAMQDPAYRARIADTLQGMMEDPELKPMLEELEKFGPMAMIKYWNRPEVLAKLGHAMAGEDGLGFPEMTYAGNMSEETVWDAASNGDVELLQHLLAEGADPNQADEEGRTGLHFSCGYGELGCAEVLLDRGADPDRQDHNMNTPLHYSAGYGQAGAVKLLCARGADRSLLNGDGKTALEVAVLNSMDEVVAALEAP